MGEENSETVGEDKGKALNEENTRQQAEEYSVYGRQIAGSVLGTNQGMIYNGFSLKELVQLFNDMGITFTLQKENPPAEAMASFLDARKRQVAEMVRNELWDAALVNESIRDEPADRTDVAAMPATIDEWYYQLDAYERCYVIAATMLQGAPVDVVSQKAKELCQSNHTSLQELQTAGSSLVGDGILGRSASKLKRRTYTTARQIGGTSRLFWQNAEFGRRMLQFIAEESVEWSGYHSEQTFLDILQKWPEELHGEIARRAARMLGGMLAYQSTNQLWRVANAWADSKNSRNWRLAASLLGGAYEIGYCEADRRTGSEIMASVLRLLRQWGERFTLSANTRVACAAAQAYSLLGRWSLEQALQGLNSLLQVPQKKVEKDKETLPGELASTLVSAYISLTWQGSIRGVLAALAEYAEQWSHQYSPPTKIGEYQYYRQRRELILNVTFDTFFLIASSSLSVAQDVMLAEYSATLPLPASPPLPDHEGRDVLLAGLLSAGETVWGNQLTVLLCAAIVEGKNKPAFELLQQWATMVLVWQGGEAQALYINFVRFMATLAKLLEIWCRDLESRGMTRQLPIKMYREMLSRWMKESHSQSIALGRLAQDVLFLIGSHQ